MQVAVTGAGGKTGSLTVKRLLADSDKYSVIAVVRSEEVRALDDAVTCYRMCRCQTIGVACNEPCLLLASTDGTGSRCGGAAQTALRI